jgi:hypothetical protein
VANTYTLLEYVDIGYGGGGLEPPATRTTDIAFGATTTLQSGTRFFTVIPDADMRLLVATTLTAATADDYKVLAGVASGANVRPQQTSGQTIYINTAAA